MSNSPHDATGKQCSNPKCQHKFTPASMTLSINFKSEDGFIERRRVCGKCYNEHYSKGE